MSSPGGAPPAARIHQRHQPLHHGEQLSVPALQHGNIAPETLELPPELLILACNPRGDLLADATYSDLGGREDHVSKDLLGYFDEALPDVLAELVAKGVSELGRQVVANLASGAREANQRIWTELVIVM